MPLTPFEIISILLTVLSCWFAMTRAANAPRQAWRAQAAALGVGLICLGVGGTTWLFRSNLDAAIGMSATTRNLVFEAGLAHAHRPLLISVVGLLMYTALLRSSGNGDAHNVRTPGNLLAMVMVVGAIGTLATAAVYTVLMSMGNVGPDDARTTALMHWNLILATGTFVIAMLGFLWGTVRSSAIAAA
jgi:hypothetical protein